MTTKLTRPFRLRATLAATLLFALPLPLVNSAPGLTALLPVSVAQAREDNNVRNTPAMREGTYRRFTRVRDLADEGEMDRAFDALETLDMDSLNSYERAMRWNLAAFLHYQNEDLKATANAYGQLLKEPELPISLEQDTRYSLARVHTSLENYDKAIEALDGWFAMKEEPGADAYALKAQLHFRQEQWSPAEEAINQAIALRREDSREVAENWYLLKRGIHYQQQDYVALKSVLQVLVREYGKKDYLMQLSAVYGELDQPEAQLAVREAAYEKGYLETENELIGLAQMMASENSPYKAARVIEKALEAGQVDPEYKHVKRMGDYYLMAKEYEEAMSAFARAAEKREDGELHLRMAQVALDLGDWPQAAGHAAEAINRGGFEKVGQAFMVQGLAHFNLENYDQSLDALRQARQHEDTANSGKQWFDYVRREQERHQELEASAQPVADPGA